MTETRVIDEIKERLGDKVTRVDHPLANRAFIYVEAEDVPEAARVIFEDMKGRFATATGLDSRDYIEVLYHFPFDKQDVVVTVKTKVAKPFPEIASISPIIPAAQWIEREMHDLLGIEFKGHPDMRRLILADDWPEGVHPLSREYSEPRQPPGPGRVNPANESDSGESGEQNKEKLGES
jgi:Ni,Fe-hydrogenase III component G